MNKLLPLVLSILTATPAAFSSVVLFSNFGPPGNPHNSGGWVVNNSNQVSFGFSVNSAAPLLEITAPVFWTAPAPSILPNQPLLVELLGPYPSGQQTPGASAPVIESWTVTPTGISASTTVQHLASLLQPVLDPQQRYFVRMSSAGLSEIFQWAWNINNQGTTGLVFGNPSSYIFSPNQSSPTLEVLGADSSGVPEPASAALMLAGLVAGVLMRVQRVNPV